MCWRATDRASRWTCPKSKSDSTRPSYGERNALGRQTACCAAYKKTLAEDATWRSFAVSELEGCGDAWIAERLKEGRVSVSLKYPDLLPVLQTCAVAATRRTMLAAGEVEAYAGNLELVAEGIALRKRIAKLLGFYERRLQLAKGGAIGSILRLAFESGFETQCIRDEEKSSVS